MKQIDKTTEHKLRWLFLPCLITAVIVGLDLFLKWNLNSEEWATTALMITLAIPVLGYCIAAIRQKCWGQLAGILIIAIIAYLNMTSFFVDLFIPEE